MVEVRIHGRGGQGVVTASDLLAQAAFQEGHHAQAFPSFGSERTGAPVVSFCRIRDTPIRVREPVMHPDVVIVQDATLLHAVDLFAGLAPDGYVLINSDKTLEELGIEGLQEGRPPGRIVAIPATEIAIEHVGRPLPNAVLLGGAASLTGLVTLEAVQRAIGERFPGAVGKKNSAAAQAAYRLVEKMKEEQAGA